MKAEERIAQLEAENAALREQVSQLQARLAELEGRMAKDSPITVVSPHRAMDGSQAISTLPIIHCPLPWEAEEGRTDA